MSRMHPHQRFTFRRDGASMVVPVIGFLVLLAPLCLLFLGTATAGVYKYKDKDGVLTVTDTQPKGRSYEVLLETPARKSRTKAPTDRRRFKMSPQTEREYDPLIERCAYKTGLSSPLLRAIIKTESNFNRQAVSPKGACGLMQLMPQTWRIYGVTDPFNPEENIRAGSAYFREQLDIFKDVNLALAAYNAGPDAVQRHGGIPPFDETQRFVEVVNEYWAYYRQQEKQERKGKKFQAPRPEEKSEPLKAGDRFSGRVIRVVNGDTITVMRDRFAVRVRLYGIDCPDKDQAYADEALQYTTSQALNKEVEIDVINRDRYGRVIGNVILPDRRNLNHELIIEGLAWWFQKKWPKDRTLATLEAGARLKKQGVWSQKAPKPPWTRR